MKAPTDTDQRFLLRIDSGSAAERLEMLRRALSITGTVELDEADAAVFTGEAHGRIFGDLMIHMVDAAPLRMTRDRAWVRNVRRDLIFLNHVLEGEMVGRYRGRPYRVGSGCLTLSRLSSEMDVTMPRRRTALAIPWTMFEQWVNWRESFDGRVFPADDPTTLLLGHYLEGLLALPNGSRGQNRQVATATLNLVSGLLGAKPSSPSRTARLQDDLSHEIRRFILRRLGDCELNAAMICREFGLSPSRLNRLLGKGFNLAATIRRMRLHRAYQDMLDARQALPLKVIAEKWGIADAGTFRRTFRAEFGLPPSAILKRGALTTESTARIARSMAELEHWFKEG